MALVSGCCGHCNCSWATPPPPSLLINPPLDDTPPLSIVVKFQRCRGWQNLPFRANLEMQRLAHPAESDSTSFWDSSRRPQKPSFDSKKNNLNFTVSVPDPPSGWEVSDGEPHYSHIHFTPLNKTFLSLRQPYYNHLSKKILKLRPRRRQLMFMFRHFFAVTLGHGSFSQPRNTNIFTFFLRVL